MKKPVIKAVHVTAIIARKNAGKLTVTFTELLVQPLRLVGRLNENAIKLILISPVF